MEELTPEAYEQLRRKNLAELQEAATKSRTGERAWHLVFRERAPEDDKPYLEGMSIEFMWVPLNPYETMAEMAERIERGCGQEARHSICLNCACGQPVIWGGFADCGLHIWQHELEQTTEKAPTWIDRLVSKLGYEVKTETETCKFTITCPASRIIQTFRLVPVPAIPGTGVNLGSYSIEHPAPYGDPGAR